MIQFDLPKQKSSIIKVLGVGGGGSNAVNFMFQQDIEGVDFIICNTDSKAIEQSPVPNKIQLGPHLTQGLGAGAELRQPLGIAVVGGLLVSQAVTLLITPVIYLYLDKYSGTGPMDIPPEMLKD